jgi:hypothetical protein
MTEMIKISKREEKDLKNQICLHLGMDLLNLDQKTDLHHLHQASKMILKTMILMMNHQINKIITMETMNQKNLNGTKIMTRKYFGMKMINHITDYKVTLLGERSK